MWAFLAHFVGVCFGSDFWHNFNIFWAKLFLRISASREGGDDSVSMLWPLICCFST